jgi:hypothetical protein
LLAFTPLPNSRNALTIKYHQFHEDFNKDINKDGKKENQNKNKKQIMVNDIELNADQLRLSVHPGFALDVMRRFVKPVVSSMLVVTKDLSELGLLGKSTSTASIAAGGGGAAVTIVHRDRKVQ